MFGDVSTSSAWVTTVYLSEIAFLFHLPILFALDPAFIRPIKTPSTPKYGPTTVWERLLFKWQRIKVLYGIIFLKGHAVRDDHLYQHRTLGLYIPLEITIFLVRGVLNTMAIYYIFFNLDEVVDKSTTAIIDSILFSPEARHGWRYFAISLIPWGFSYVIHRYHIMRYRIHIYPGLYRFSHLSVLNFALDLPGWNIPTVHVSHYMVVLSNICIQPYITYEVYAAIPLILAWSCYMISYSYFDINGFKYGMCPAIYSSDTARLEPVCTQPYARCGEGITLKNRAYDHIWHIMLYYMAIIGTIYMATITPKIQYYQESILGATPLKKNN